MNRMPLHDFEARVRKLVVRARVAILCGACLRAALVVGLVGGALVLLARVGFGQEPGRGPTLVAFLVLAVALGLWRARGRRLSSTAAAAWIDVESGRRGTLLTSLERPDPRWQPALEAVLARPTSLPGLRLRRPLLESFCGLGFLLLAASLRLPEPTPGPATAVFETAVERLAERLFALEESVELDPEDSAELSERLAALREALDADGPEASPESLYEALDRLEEDLARRAEEVQRDAQDVAQHLTAASELAASQPQAAAQELAAALAALEAAGLAPRDEDALRELLASGSLEAPSGMDPGELMELSDELRELLEGQLGELAEAGLLSPGKLGELGEGELADLSGFGPSDHECDENCEPGGT